MEVFSKIIGLVKQFPILLVIIFLAIFLSRILNNKTEIVLKLCSTKRVSEENVFDVKAMSEEEKKIFIYTLLNTKLNKDNLDKAETMSKKCKFSL
jgi:hypothetical protein